MPIHDRDPSAIAQPTPDPHGQAALLLVESLIHGMISRSIITADDAIDMVEGADSVQVEFAEQADGAGDPMWRAHALLAAIAESLRTDIRDGNGPGPLHSA